MDLEALYRKLEFAAFAQREQVAADVVRDTPREELGPIVRGLEHPLPAVRLGVIEILRRAAYREGLRKLLAHALAHDGDDRVFAVRAIAQIAEPGDDFLAAEARRWLTSGDAFLEPHARRIVERLTADTPKVVVAAPPPDTLDRLVVLLFSAVKGAERIALVEQIERRGPQALAAAAKLTFAKGNEHLVAYMARAVIRNASTLPKPESLIPLLEATRKRLGHAPIANAAIDDALLALGGLTLSTTLLSRIGEMDKPQVDAVVVRLADREPTEVALHVPVLLDALARRPALWSSLGPALVHAAGHVRESTRVELRTAVERAIDELRQGKALPPITLASVTWVLAKIGERGEPLPRQLWIALDRVAVVESALALVALCARLGTEEAAIVLLAMLRDPLPAARVAARDAVQSWTSPWIGLEADQIVHRYTDDKGEPLVRRGDKLVLALSGEEYVLDGRGRPVRQGDTAHGGCACCAPSRALVKRGDDVRCPTTWQPYQRDGAPGPAVPSEGRGGNDDALPQPPSKDELTHVAPHIRRAIESNVFLHARDGDQRWNGSGIVIARDGNHILVLTNRHVVESDDRARLCAIDAMTVSGEAIRMTCVWRANKGVDLALVEGRVERPGELGVMPLGAGVGLVGAEVFAIGNPLGLAWSYTAGTLGAIRHWTTQDGQSVRILQTDANIAPGSSGGGLFHSDGHLLGVMSFLRQGHAGGSAHFALSIDAIREAFAREDVRWHGATLARIPE